MGNKGHTYPRTCVVCGEPFQATSPTGKYCFKPECRERRSRDVKKRKAENQAKRRTGGLIINEPDMSVSKARAIRAFRKSDASIREIVRKAAELGLSYGQYVGRCGNGRDSKV